MAAVAGCGGGGPSRDLATELVDRVREADPDLKLTRVDDVTIEFESPGGTTGTLSLHNLRANCEGNPGSCDEAIQYFADSLRESVSGVDEIKPLRAEDVRAVLKDREYLAAVAEATADSPPDKRADNAVVQAPFAGELFAMYVVDQPRTMRGLTQGDLRALGLDETQVHALALENLSRAFPEPIELSPTDTPGLDKLASDDPYAAARLLIHDRWEPLNARMSGGLVACSPARDLVLVTGADDADALSAMRRMAAEEAASAPYPLSAQLLRWTPAGWEVSR